MKNKKYLQSADLGFIAYLLCKGYKFALPPFKLHHYVHFTFDRSPEIDEQHDLYYSGQTQVESFGYNQTLINLRHQVQKLIFDNTLREIDGEVN